MSAPPIEPYYPRSAAADAALHPFRTGDEDRAWRLDFHFPRGILPLSHDLVADGLMRASAEAARTLPSPVSDGLDCRVAGPHVYTAGRPVNAETAGARAEAAAAVRDRFPAEFRAVWAEQTERITSRLRALDLSLPADRHAIAAHYEQAVAAHRYAWQVHFDVMYRLLLVYERYVSECAEAGIDRAAATAALRTDESRIRATDRELVRLARFAEDLGLRAVFAAHNGPELYRTLREDERAGPWLTRFGTFLAAFGQRCDGVLDVAWPSWAEDPSRPLDLVRSALLGGQRRTLAEDGGLPSLRGLGPAAARRVRAAFATARRANFVWWNEEHNFYIDLRAHLPVRRAGLAAGELAFGRAEDGLFLFGRELLDWCAGAAETSELADLVAQRRAFSLRWQRNRRLLPASAGTGPGEDPIVREIFGVNGSRPMPDAGHAPALMLTGMGVSAGVGRGRARVLRSPEEITTLRSGDVLVCEATTPNWTPVFGLLAGCVCDSGGALTHAAIVSREYGLPCVVATGNATAMIEDGDEIEVDGRRGLVIVLSRRSR